MGTISKETNFISAVVYCHNDEGHIGSFIKQLNEALAKNFLKYEIIVVNDYSTDEGINEIKQYASTIENTVISIINMGYFHGLEASMNSGVKLSIGDFVYEFDSVIVDYSWNLLMEVYFHTLSGYDIVNTRNDIKPNTSSRLFYWLFNRYARLQYKVGNETFRLLSRRAINRVHSLTQRIPFRKAAYANCGLAIDTLFYKSLTPASSKSRNGKQRLAIDSLLLYTDVGYRLTVGLALIMFILCISIIIYALIYRIMETPVEGWTTTVIFNSLGFSGLFLILSVIIKYLQTLLQLIFRKKEFVFESIKKLQ